MYAGKFVQSLKGYAFLVQGGMHGASQGIMAMMDGGNFFQGFVSGALGSIAASGWTGAFGSGTGGMIAFSALAGGIGAELSGGNFFKGFLQGGIVAGLNHAMHSADMEPDNGYDENGKKVSNKGGDKTDFFYDKNGNEIASTSVNVTFSQGGEVSSSFEGYGFRHYTQGTGGAIQMMGGPFDPFGFFEGAGMAVESWLTGKGYSTFGKAASLLVAAKLGGLKGNILTNTTKNGTTLLKTSKNFRIDLDTKNALHYHRRGPGGIARHRPWQVKPGDKGNFWKRF